MQHFVNQFAYIFKLFIQDIPCLLLFVRLNMIVPPKSMKQVCRRWGTDCFEDCYISLRWDVPAENKPKINSLLRCTQNEVKQQPPSTETTAPHQQLCASLGLLLGPGTSSALSAESQAGCGGSRALPAPALRPA